MVPQLEQGFLQPQVLLGTGKPQRLHVGGAVEVVVPRSLPSDRICPTRGRPAAPPPRCPTVSPKRIRSGEERVGNPLDPDRGVGAMAAMQDGGIGQREEFGLDGGHENRRISAR
jgi:hypothetical protein